PQGRGHELDRRRGGGTGGFPASVRLRARRPRERWAGRYRHLLRLVAHAARGAAPGGAGRWPGRRQRGHRHPARATMGRGRVQRHRDVAGHQESRKNAGFRESRPIRASIMTIIDDYHAWPDAAGRFGDFGGTYVAETLMAPLAELTEAYLRLRQDPDFVAELDRDLAHY